jgi:hypothetical protein
MVNASQYSKLDRSWSNPSLTVRVVDARQAQLEATNPSPQATGRSPTIQTFVLCRFSVDVGTLQESESDSCGPRQRCAQAGLDVLALVGGTAAMGE